MVRNRRRDADLRPCLAGTMPRVTFSRLWTFMAVVLPVLAALLASISTVDLAYQVQSGQLILDHGAILRADPFTFTAGGQPWLDQQWGAQVLFAVIYRVAGWAGHRQGRLLLPHAGQRPGNRWLADRLGSGPAGPVPT